MARILHLGVCCNTVYRKDLMLSVVVPAYNENENVSRAAKTISRILEDAAIPFEIIFIDDGSQGETWGRICEESSKHDFVRGHFVFAELWKRCSDFCGAVRGGRGLLRSYGLRSAAAAGASSRNVPSLGERL